MQYTTYTDPLTGLDFRDGAATIDAVPQYVIDKEIIAGGFDLDLGAREGEGVGWVYIGGAM
jgi:hypothetical protein